MKALLLLLIGTLVSLTQPAQAGECDLAKKYIGSIFDKLVSASEKVPGLKQIPISLEIDCWKHGDFAGYGGGKILYSSNFATRLKYEDEVAFILAHELAHAFRNHQMGKEILSLENEADSYALSIMTAASYQPSFSISSVVKGMLRYVDNDDNPYYLVHKDDSHLPLPARIKRLAQLIKEKGLVTRVEGTTIPEQVLIGMTSELLNDE